MSQKIFSEEGSRLHTFAGEQEHQWELRDTSGKVHFTGTAEELDIHIKTMFEQGKYSNKSKRGRRKKVEY